MRVVGVRRAPTGVQVSRGCVKCACGVGRSCEPLRQTLLHAEGPVWSQPFPLRAACRRLSMLSHVCLLLTAVSLVEGRWESDRDVLHRGILTENTETLLSRPPGFDSPEQTVGKTGQPTRLESDRPILTRVSPGGILQSYS
jgi:hypothetical protein